MNKQMFIPTHFKVPNSCTHRWLLFNADSVSEIRGVPGKNKLSFSWRGHNPKPEHASLGMDWMEESVEHLRSISQ